MLHYENNFTPVNIKRMAVNVKVYIYIGHTDIHNV